MYCTFTYIHLICSNKSAAWKSTNIWWSCECWWLRFYGPHCRLVHCTGWAKKSKAPNTLHITSSMLADFHNFFSITFSTKFAIKWSLNILHVQTCRYTNLWNEILCQTRKLCYRKGDRAMRPIPGCPKKFRDSLTTPTATNPNIFLGLLFGSTL